MKHFKRILVLVLIGCIAWFGYDMYSKLKHDHIQLDSAMFFEPSTAVLDLDTPNNSIVTSAPITLEDSSTSSTSATASSTSSSTNLFFYQQLDNTAKILYSKLEANISHLTDTNFKMDFSTQFNTLLHQDNGTQQLSKSFQAAIDAFLYDHPELFYLDLTKISLLTKSRSIAGITTYYVSIVPQDNTNYLYSQFSDPATLQKAIQQVEEVKTSFVSKVSGTTYQKVSQVHDTLVDRVSYDRTYHGTNSYNLYGSLVEKSAVCEGYAKAMKYILDSLHIPCILVSGTATNTNGETESHMWNYVQIDGAWYGLDATWDDPIVYVNGKRQKETVRHDYLCKGSATFASSHKLDGRISDDGMIFQYPTLSTHNYK